MTNTTSPGLGLFVLTGLVVMSALAAALWARRRNRPGLLRTALIGSAVWSALYVAALVAVSLTSAPRVLEAGEPKAFCGFYLDCHVSVALEQVETAEAIGSGASRIDAEGTFYIVAVRYGSDAIDTHLTPSRPTAIVRDARGRTYERSALGERAFAATGRPSLGESRTLAPGEFYVTHFVFDLPPDVEEPVLDVSSGWGVDRLAELLLIGDEDSIFHARTVFRLATPARGDHARRL